MAVRPQRDPAPGKPPLKSVATSPAQQPQPEPAPGKKKKGRKWLWLTLLALLAIGGGAAAWLLMDEAPADGKVAAAPEKPPIFVSLDTFTVNLQQEVSDQYLQTALVVRVKDNAAVDAIKLLMPEVRYRLLLLLSSKKPSELTTVTGKEGLAAEIVKEVQQTLPAAVRESVSAVYFTSFVIQ